MPERKATVAVIGAGGAEAALAKKYSQSPHVGKIIAIPGNDMVAEICEKPAQTFQHVKVDDEMAIAKICKREEVVLADIRNERAIQAGLTGQLKLRKIPTVGPTSNAGRLEWDKYYSRATGEYIGLPQPKFRAISFKDLPWGKTVPDYYEKVFAEFDEKPSLLTVDSRYFVKAAGLFDGKGVIEARSREEIERAISALREQNPKAAETILIEDALRGEEFSSFAISDGRNFKILGYAQDHKRAYDGDRGPNTGGMGAVSHPVIAESKTLRQSVDSIYSKTLEHLRNVGDRYRGILYLGGMAAETVAGQIPSVVEFNCRWGDPEAQVIIPGLNVDFFEMGMEAAKGTLRRVNISDDGLTRIAVAVATNEDFDSTRRTEIKSIKELKRLENIDLYGARVMVEDEKYWVGGPGRIFHLGASGQNILEARAALEPALEIIRGMDGENLYSRTDIGFRDVERLRRSSV